MVKGLSPEYKNYRKERRERNKKELGLLKRVFLFGFAKPTVSSFTGFGVYWFAVLLGHGVFFSQLMGLYIACLVMFILTSEKK